MPKAKKASKRHRFDYNKDRKKLKKQFIKKYKPRIEHPQIRHAWDDNKSTARNLQEMGLAFDPNRALPVKKQRLIGEDGESKAPAGVVTKPYILTHLQEEASLPEKDTKTLSSDLIEFVQHMIREHKDDYKDDHRQLRLHPQEAVQLSFSQWEATSVRRIHNVDQNVSPPQVVHPVAPQILTTTDYSKENIMMNISDFFCFSHKQNAGF
uniref:Nucleolar protein 16 n=1 Tax=Amphiprion ocellaris TaxID=80972 RepID=A0AAQ5ZAS4_AMPOC